MTITCSSRVLIEFDDSCLTTQHPGIKDETTMDFPHGTRKVFYLVIGALLVAMAVLSYQLYQERQKTISMSDISTRETDLAA